jgi:hypothetical protein
MQYTDPLTRRVNAQGLMDLIRANEEAPDFNLGTWMHPCRTYGCLVGNWAIQCDRMFVLETDNIYGLTADSLSLSYRESSFLFCTIDIRRDEWGHPLRPGVQRDWRNREAAINRVRKFLYYKLRKRELLYEEDGRVKESARRTEGDHHVCRAALAECVA